MAWGGKSGKGDVPCPTLSAKELGKMEELLKWQRSQGKGKGKGPKETDPKGKGKTTGGGGKNDKGKGKGKGDTKGKGKAQTVKCAGNMCKDYNYGQPVWYPADEDQCPCCGLTNPRHDGKALDKLREATKLAEAEELKVLKKKEAAKPEAKPEVKATPKAKAQAAPKDELDEMLEDLTEEDEQEDTSASIVLTEEYVSLKVLLKAPHTIEEGWEAAKSMDLCASADPQSVTAPIKKSIAQCQAPLELEEAGDALGTKIDFEAAKKRMAALEKQLTKAEGATPGAALTKCQLETNRQSFVDSASKKKGFADAGTKAAAGRQKRLEEICLEMMAAWETQLQELRQEAADRNKLWTERQELLQSRTDQVLKLYDERIAAVEAIARAVDPVAAAKKDAETLEQTTADLCFQKLKTKASVVLQLSDMPVLDLKPPDDTVPALAQMHYWAQKSVFMEACLPYTFGDMGATVPVAISLVGLKVWRAYFGDNVCTPDEVCPLQLRGLIFRQLAEYDRILRGSKHCFIKEHADQEMTAQRAVEAAAPRLEKMKKVKKNHDAPRNKPY